MVVVTIKRHEGQDGKPTNPKLIKLLNETKDLRKVPHQFFFPETVLKNLIIMKKAVLKNIESYKKSGGGNKLTSAVIVVDGKSNSGKTTLGSQIALFFDPTVTLEKNYAWNMDRLMHLADNAKAGDAIVMDEGMIFNSRKANSDDNIKLIVTLSQIRSKGIFFIFCINSVHQLEKTIPLSRANCLFHVRRIGGINGTPKYVAYDENRMRDLVIKNSGKYSYKGVLPNTNWATFSKYFFADDVRYDKMKHRESLKNVANKDKISKNQKKTQIALMKLVEHCRDLGLIKTYPEFSKITGIPQTTLSEYKRRYPEELGEA